MLRFTSLLIVLFTLLTAATCNRTTQQPLADSKCFKGKLVIKGICMNYVVQVLQGDTSQLNINDTWIDETTDKTYANVFALGSKCNFPDMAEGDEFYFKLAEKPEAGCNVCLAYRPVPTASNHIVVNKESCP
jgi:hypothetical protein